MNFYRCYFLSASNAIKDVAEFGSRSDGEALAHAQSLFKGQARYCGYELWEGVRRVHCELAALTRD